jgi:uncharacterized membrane protein
MNIFKILLYIHIACGAISLLLGLFILFLKKGNALHKKIGIFYYYFMLIAALISFPMSYMHSNYFLFIIGVFTSYMLLTGKRHLKKKDISDVNTIDWALTFMMLAFGIAFITFGLYKLINADTFGIVLLVFGGISIFFVWMDKRNFQGKSRYKNYWLTTHIQRMVASYIATVTAFLVVNNRVLPDMIAWLLPTFLLVPLIVKWIIKYHIRAVRK